MKRILLLSAVFSLAMVPMVCAQDDDADAKPKSVKERAKEIAAKVAKKSDADSDSKSDAGAVVKKGSIKDRIAAIQNKSDSDSKSSAKPAPSNNIAKCTKKAEEISATEVHQFLTDLIDFDKADASTHAILKNPAFKAFDEADRMDKAEEYSERLKRRHVAIFKAHADKGKGQTAAIVSEILDEDKAKERRHQKMKDADKEKDALIRKYTPKVAKGLSDNDIALLAAQGVLFDTDTKQFEKTKDKLIEVSPHQPNPVNTDAFEWFTAWMKACRTTPADFLESK